MSTCFAYVVPWVQPPAQDKIQNTAQPPGCPQNTQLAAAGPRKQTGLDTPTRSARPRGTPANHPRPSAHAYPSPGTDLGRQRSAWAVHAAPRCADGTDAQTLSGSPRCSGPQLSRCQTHSAPLQERGALSPPMGTRACPSHKSWLVSN